MPHEERRDAAQGLQGAGDRQLTCFVVTGFGRKTDYATGRVLDLDKTYEQLVRPAFDRVGINCFRAIDANLTGSIDSIMYKWIYQADFVIADLSTLNANVFYELGVRHAQKPNTTIIIAESVLMQKIPFDLSSFVIHQYEHGGEEIAAEEQERFVGHLEKLLRDILALEERRTKTGAVTPRLTDSPVFTFLGGMAPPNYDLGQQLEPPRYVPPEERAATQGETGASLASLIARAEAAKGKKDFPEAILLFGQAVEAGRDKPDSFLAQRLALVTYKNGEVKNAQGEVDQDVAIQALHEAEAILARYCAPKISTDPETLGLCGAIHKRLFDLTGDSAYLDLAIAFYERGFYVKQDYYNGINVAFMYTIRANLLPDPDDAIVNHGHANMIRKKVAEICNALLEDEAAFHKRGDKQWVLMSLAEAYQGMGRPEDEARLAPKIEAVADDFGRHSYGEQKQRLAEAVALYQQRRGRVGPPVTASAAPGVGPASATTGGEVRTRVDVPPTTGPVVRRTITIDADVAQDRAIRTIEVNCRIDYA